MTSYFEKQIFITGANGQLGTALRKQYPGAQFADREDFDITDSSSISSHDWSKTTVLINAAAYTNVDGAETPEGRAHAWAINSASLTHLSKVAIEYDLTLIHISSDYVFDGTKESHDEDEAFTPLSVYGASKAAGDIAASVLPKHYIIRTSWVIGEGGNFVRIMLGLAERGINPTVVSDQVGRLTFTSEVVRAINHLLNERLPYGTYNVTNSGQPSSWADITRAIFKYSGVQNTVTDISTAEYYKDKSDIAPRPLQSTLSLRKIQSTGFRSRDWHDDLKEYIAKEQS